MALYGAIWQALGHSATVAIAAIAAILAHMAPTCTADKSCQTTSTLFKCRKCSNVLHAPLKIFIQPSTVLAIISWCQRPPIDINRKLGSLSTSKYTYKACWLSNANVSIAINSMVAAEAHLPQKASTMLPMPPTLAPYFRCSTFSYTWFMLIPTLYNVYLFLGWKWFPSFPLGILSKNCHQKALFLTSTKTAYFC